MELNRRDCSILRGWAIICIILHNFCHWLPDAPKENEFYWSSDNVDCFIQSFLNGNVFISFFSFLGHYGVPVFVFLSGYGLVKKYGTDKLHSKSIYVVNHLLKLTKLMLPGLVFYLFLSYLLTNSFDGMTIVKFVLQTLYLSNLIPSNYLSIIPGPYWYFGLTIQLYLVYLLLLKNIFKRLSFFIILYIALMLISYNHHYLTVWLKYNFIGSVVPFALGAIFAKCDFDFYTIIKRNPVIVAFISFVIILSFEYSYYTWLFISVPVVVFSISIMILSRGFVGILLTYIGNKSHIIFVFHPTLRILIFYLYDYGVLNWQTGLILYFVLSLLFASFISQLKWLSNK